MVLMSTYVNRLSTDTALNERLKKSKDSDC